MSIIQASSSEYPYQQIAEQLQTMSGMIDKRLVSWKGVGGGGRRSRNNRGGNTAQDEKKRKRKSGWKGRKKVRKKVVIAPIE